MSQLTNALLVASYAMMSVVAGVAAYNVAGASITLAWLAGASVLLVFGQIHGAVGRAQERSSIDAELQKLHRVHRIAAEELEQTKKRLKDVVNTSEEKAAARNDQIISEVKVLETLVGQLAGNIEGQARDRLHKAIEVSKGNGNAEELLEDVAASQVHSVTDLDSLLGQLSESELLEAVQAALDDNRVDVYLQPIVSLPQRKIRFYEALSRLRTEDGEVLTPGQYIHIAESAGLMSVIDNLLLFRCVQLVRRLSQQSKETAIFCNMSYHSLKDQAFFPQFMEFMSANRDLASYLIFEFSQEMVSSFTSTDTRNLRRLGDLGFRFSVDKVSTLELDLSDLQDWDFRFVKVTPDLLLSALPAEEDDQALAADFVDQTEDAEFIELVDESEVVEPEPSQAAAEIAEDSDVRATELAQRPNIHAADFKELLNRYGLDLVVEKLESERDVIEVVELNVDYGQGYIFGEPRPVRDTDPGEQTSDFVGNSETEMAESEPIYASGPR